MAYEPQPQERPAKPRTKSMLSFSSHKSSGSGPKSPKMDLTETPKDKAHRRINSKNDPNMAIKEMQPGQAAFEKTTIDSLRGIQHKDMYGNVITDPDRSNPTRPRLERPLDTIRSFEAAIDGSYGRRHSTMRPISRDGFQSRRSSYYQGYTNGGSQPRYQPDNAYNGGAGYNNGGHNGGPRMGPPRHENHNEGYNRNSPAPFRDPRRMSGVRNHSDPMLYGANGNGNGNGNSNSNGNGTYAGNHNYQQSYDTATSGSGSGGSYGTDAWGNSTDPSSENSSVDRIPQPPPKADLGEQYGFNGFNGGTEFQGPILEEGLQGAPAYGQPGYGRQAQNGAPAHYGNGNNVRMGGYPPEDVDMPPPPPPHKHGAGTKLQRKPIQEAGPPSTGPTEAGEKRKSWLKRRFSKNS